MDQEIVQTLQDLNPFALSGAIIIYLLNTIVSFARSKNGAAPATRQEVREVRELTEKLLDRIQTHGVAEERVMNEMIGVLRGIQDQLRLQSNKQEQIFRDLIELRADLRSKM
jgi:hypothetical protein